MKEHQLLIGLSLIAISLYFGISKATWTEYESCMKYEQLDLMGTVLNRSEACRNMIMGR